MQNNFERFMATDFEKDDFLAENASTLEDVDKLQNIIKNATDEIASKVKNTLQ